MTPAEIDASPTEPDWVAQWQILRVADDGFSAILRQWRRWHWTPIEVEGQLKKKPGRATNGIIALALLGIMPLGTSGRSAVISPALKGRSAPWS